MTDILGEHILSFDMQAAVEHICEGLRDYLRRAKKRGVVVAVSGGIDSSVCTALSVLAVGKKRVFGLLLPEYDSSPESTKLGEMLARHAGIDFLSEDIGPALQAIGCYRWRDEAIRRIFPEYESSWKNKIVIAGGRGGVVNHFNLVVEDPSGRVQKARMGLKEYLQIVAATSYKQRVRKTVEYFHGDRLNYAVIGTPNRLEYDQGFFVKNGDGSADVKPIAHLYKTQVYALARHLALPEEICSTEPTTDTYSMEQKQDEFYFALPYKEMDVALWCFNNKRSKEELAEALDIGVEQAEFIFKDIETKRKTTSNLHWRPVVLDEIVGPMTQYP